MAEEATTEATPAPKKKSKLPLVIVAVVVLAGLGAGGRFLMRAHGAPAQANAADTNEVKSVLHLESFVVNLQGTQDNGYLRLGVDLGLGVEMKEGDKQSPSMGKLRDTILTVLGTRTVDELLTPEGKEKLKADMLQAINDRVPEIKCQEIYFTEFLVQR
jgi:flagellar protein FliL